MDPWGLIKADREALADYLGALAPDDWLQPSLCEGWSIRDVALHLLVTPSMSKGKVVIGFIGSGFNLDRFSQKQIDRMANELSTDQIVATTRDTAGVQSAPPGLKPVGVLGEVLTHGGDIALALGKPLTFDSDHYVLGLDYMKDAQPVLGCKKRIEGLTLHATDADWSTGSGPAVTGDAQHLLSAMAGRKASIDALSGDGVDILRSRP